MAPATTMSDQDLQDSQYLSNSLSSLSRSRSTNSLIVRTYKEATQLYLTKRFKEALETLEPIISPRRASEASAINGLAAENGAVDASGNDGQLQGDAPVAQSSRGTRTKVWVFYLSLLHAIIEMGAEEGRLQFGSGKWKELALKARDGKVWEEVVQHGFGGNEGNVDPDVVVNLATLLIEHMHDQRLTQHRLEVYLSSTEFPGNGAVPDDAVDGMGAHMGAHSSSPKALQTRLKILELYTLHVLPANGEWQYAQDFIDQSDALDYDRKEAFSNALQQLKEEKDGQTEKERVLVEQQQRELEQARREEEERQRVEAARQHREEEEKKQRSAQQTSVQSPKQHKSTPASTGGVAKASAMRPSQGVFAASTAALLRLVMFMLAFLVILVRRDLRIKLRRVLEGTWTKIRQTIGMGVKVSYV
ncbi:hypothetical protein K431DRAFT_234628 [Polychaeton citri CBS 116435]|uniref:Peroxin 26 n=1 Tax=Polychaeton citri CBS 116435 TaxID=1314669 RepID=A0A9P4Q2D8_9PEZI|nr:hypothetical protein K431DRAFT_234628 [Polychaeton citri CBS 116435]